MSGATITQTSVTETPSDNRNVVLRTGEPDICRFFLQGTCRYGPRCRYSHAQPNEAIPAVAAASALSADAGARVKAQQALQLPSIHHNQPQHPQQQQQNQTKVKPINVMSTSTSKSMSNSNTNATTHNNWVNAPVFVPRRLGGVDDSSLAHLGINETDEHMRPGTSNKTWASVVGANSAVLLPREYAVAASMDMVCPYEPPCPYNIMCAYSIHLEQCKMCDQYCLHPNDPAQRRKHNQECLQHHEQAMELSFAIARSKDKTCGICFDTIVEKAGREKRFGILNNCNHIFCLECIRKWRQAKQFEHKITRSCPECRVSSDFVCPSAFWVDTKEEKDKLLSDYRSALNIKDCKYFKRGEGKCPFGNKCFYRHALPNGDLVDVGRPKRGRRLQRSTSEIIDLFDIYLWEFVEQRDYHFLDVLSGTSDESDDSDWSEE